MKTIERFLEHCNIVDAGFSCYDYEDRSQTPKYVARIKHLLQDGASPESLKKVAKWIDDPGGHIRDFYSVVDGAFLYVDSISGNRPFELCSIPDWPISTHAMKKWYLTKDAVFDGEIDFLTNGYAIGRINQTPDYISIIATGENAGKIFHVAHDDFSYEPMAQSFDDFIDQMITDPASFLDRIGAFAFYSDGSTTVKWVPKSFCPDVTRFTIQ
jgi:hypothetical protein